MKEENSNFNMFCIIFERSIEIIFCHSNSRLSYSNMRMDEKRNENIHLHSSFLCIKHGINVEASLSWR